MGKTQTFQQFLATQATHIPLFSLVLNVLIAAGLATVLSYIYVKNGRSLSNRKMFSDNFMLMAITTTLIITIVKSSLALSLGLVGALSIVRFRAAIKEPEELSYLFLCIAIGLGLGADQRVVTIVAFVITIALIELKAYKHKNYHQNQNLCLTVSNVQSKGPIELSSVVDVLKKSCKEVHLRRFDETQDVMEASFLIACDDFDNLKKCKAALRKLNKSIAITFLDNKSAV